jgi:KUP system potassium uptake protein
VTSQAAQLGYLPRLRVAHTSESTIGQIYVPRINWLFMVSVLTLVFAFRSSAALAYAFGTGMITTITITTLLFFYLARVHWRTPVWLIAVGAGTLLTIDLLFLAANLTKLVHGAWLPLLVGLIAFTVMTTWQHGRTVVTRERDRAEGPLHAFVDRLHEDRTTPTLVPGTAIFLNRGKRTAPLAMRANVEHNHVLHQQVLIMSIETLPVPHVPDPQRIQIDNLGYAGDGIIHVTARFGYMQTPDIPAALRLLEPEQTEGPISLDLAHARLVLTHLSEREEAIRRLIASLRPGGWLVVEDFDGTLPACLYALTEREQLVNRIREAFRELLHRRGGDTTYVHTLSWRLHEAGLVVANPGPSLWAARTVDQE